MRASDLFYSIHIAVLLMTQPVTPDRSNDESAQTSGSAVAAEAAPPEETRPEPEPWTGERASEWNNYYDLYVTLGVLLLVFVVSANKITQSSVWTQLQVGQMIAARNAPILTDVFSYTREGTPGSTFPGFTSGVRRWSTRRPTTSRPAIPPTGLPGRPAPTRSPPAHSSRSLRSPGSSRRWCCWASDAPGRVAGGRPSA